VVAIIKKKVGTVRNEIAELQNRFYLCLKTKSCTAFWYNVWGLIIINTQLSK